MSINEYIATQFANPHGIGGRIVLEVMSRQNAELYDATEALLNPSSRDTILDIGCGNGIMIEKLARVCGCHLIGTDISEDALSIAKRRSAKADAELICCPVDNMPIDSATVDKAFTINTIYFWDDLKKGFDEVARVLKPGGIFVSTHYAGHSLKAFSHTQFVYKRRTEADIISTAYDAGFTAETIPIMNGRAYCLACRR